MSERTREPDRERRASGGSQTAKKKKKPVSAGSAGNRQRPAAKNQGHPPIKEPERRLAEPGDRPNGPGWRKTAACPTGI